MSCFSTTTTTFALLLLLLLPFVLVARSDPIKKHVEVVERAREGMLQAIAWANGVHGVNRLGRKSGSRVVAYTDCVVLYGDAVSRLARLVAGQREEYWSHDDALTWLSAAMASHNTCLDGLRELRVPFEARRAHNLTLLIREALSVYRAENIKNPRARTNGMKARPVQARKGGLLAVWKAENSKADYVVAQDGTGNYKTIKEAISAIAGAGRDRPERVVVHVKSGVYKENVVIELNNIMFVGDGINRTIVTGDHSVQDGFTTFSSATFGVRGDGFWARDMTFENTAGPAKHQAVAMSALSDMAVFYRCSFQGYQDTLFMVGLRQFYRECHVYGTVDFVFGDAAAVLQDCDIFVRRPMEYQSNMITAQGRDMEDENTGISIVSSRVRAAPDLEDVKGRFKTYLGRPWKKYSRTAFLKTDLDDLIDPMGWMEWSGDFALSTLYYAEFMNTGAGAATEGRVNWKGFHVLRDAREAEIFGIRDLIKGDNWIPTTGVPFAAGF